MAIEEPRTNSVATRVNSQAAVVVLAVVAEPVVRVELAALAAQAARVASAEPVVLVVQVASVELVAPVGLAVLAELEVREASAGQVVQVELAELVKLAIVPAAVRAPVTGPEAARELQIAQEVPVETDHPHDHLAIQVRRTSAIAPLHPAKVRVHGRAAALAAAAETTHEQAATEAAKAWVVVE
jgi:hypothetical protein